MNTGRDFCKTITAFFVALRLSGYNQIVRKNEIFNSYHQVISLSGNDHIIEYNDIHHTTRWTGDMGAIYWLAGPSSIGHETRYNYFHDNGSSYFGGWSQCIFWEDYVNMCSLEFYEENLASLDSENVTINTDFKLYIFKSDNLAPIISQRNKTP